MIHDSSATEDIVQEVFLRIWTRAEQWHGRGSLKSWLFRIATNLALNHVRTLPEGLTYVASWVEDNFDRCFQLMETEETR